MPCQNCIELDIPEHLCSEGKDGNVPLIVNETLYRRFDKKVPDGILPKDYGQEYQQAFFKFNNDSYNRSNFSSPEDVLIDSSGKKHLSSGIFSIQAGILPLEGNYNINNDVAVCRIEFNHVHEECNYSHCELHCFVNNIKKDKGDPPKSLKSVFRRLLIGNIEIVKNVG